MYGRGIFGQIQPGDDDPNTGKKRLSCVGGSKTGRPEASSLKSL